jgi:hypothetical protein
MRRSLLVLAIVSSACSGSSMPNPNNPPPDDGMPPLIDRFVVTPMSYPPGGAVSISWKVEHATSVRIDGPEGTVVSTFSREGSVQASGLLHGGAFVITATDKEGTVTSSLAARIDWPDPQIVSVSSMAGQEPLSTVVLFQTRSATRVQLFADHQLLAEQILMDRDNPACGRCSVGQMTVRVTSATVSLDLVATNPKGQTDQVVLAVINSAPTLVAFQVLPQCWVGSSTTVTISWRTLFASEIALSGATFNMPEPPKGSVTLMTTGEDYTITATGIGAQIASAIIGAHPADLELEPNDQIDMAMPIATGARGSIDHTGDVDIFLRSINLPGALSIRVEAPARGPCMFPAIVELLDQSGGLVVDDSSMHPVPAGDPACAIVGPFEVSSPALIRVRASGNGVGEYVLLTRVDLDLPIIR